MWFALALLVVLVDAQAPPNPPFPFQPQGSPMCPVVRAAYDARPPLSTVNCTQDGLPGVCQYFPVKPEFPPSDNLLSWFANCVAQEIACGRENRSVERGKTNSFSPFVEKTGFFSDLFPVSNSTCVFTGRVGTCDSAQVCVLNERACSNTTTDGDVCVLAGQPGSCSRDYEEVELRCAAYANDQKAFGLCAASFGASSCQVRSSCEEFGFDPKSGERITAGVIGRTCFNGGRVGTCQQACRSPYTGEEIACPVPANGTVFTATEVQALCARISARGQGGPPISYCIQNVQGQCQFSGFTSQCVKSATQVQNTLKCARNDTVCTRVNDFCVQNDSAGLCQDTNGTLTCFDRSDRCPAGALCDVAKNLKFDVAPSGNDTDAMQGNCSSSFRCLPRSEECSETAPTNSTCWSAGFKGSCQPGVNLKEPRRCVLFDTSPCSVLGPNRACVAGGVSSGCGIAPSFFEVFCPSLYGGGGGGGPGVTFGPPRPPVFTTGVATVSQFTSAVGGSGPTAAPTAAPISFEQCKAILRDANVTERCLASTQRCFSNGDTCVIDGASGTCQSTCYLYGRSGPVPIPCGTGSLLSQADIQKLVTLACSIQKENGPPGSGTDPKCATYRLEAVQSCLNGVGYERECALRYVGGGNSVECRRTDVACSAVGSFCFKNNLTGKCATIDGVLACRTRADLCPASSSCTVPGAPSNYEGACSIDFYCQPKQLACGAGAGAEKQLCWITGKRGQCITKSASQAAQLSKCLADAKSGETSSCFDRYTACFTGCRFPGQVCGELSACAFVSKQLNCTAVSKEPPAVVEVQGGMIALAEVQAQTFDGSAYSLVARVLGEKKLMPQLSFAPSERGQGLFIVLAHDATLSFDDFEALRDLVAELKNTNGIKDAFLLVGTSAQQCDQACRNGYTCTDGKCTRILPNGVCVAAATAGELDTCMCTMGWRGTDCSEPMADNVTKLSQWVFAKPAVADGAAARKRVAGVFDSVADSVLIDISVVETDDIVTVKVFSRVDGGKLTLAQVTDLRSAHQILKGLKDLKEKTIYFPIDIPTPTLATAASSLQIGSFVASILVVALLA
jgi:hypothetical protein